MLNSFLDQLNDNIFWLYSEVKKLLMCKELLFQQKDYVFVVNGIKKIDALKMFTMFTTIVTPNQCRSLPIVVYANK